MGKKLNPDSKPAEKLLSMYTYLLLRNAEISLTDLTKELQVSKKTASSLLNQIEASRHGKILLIKKGREHFYKLDKPKDMPRLTLDAEGLNHLVMCRDFMMHLLPKSIKSNIDNTLKQVSAYSTKYDEEDNNFSIHGKGKSLTKGSIDYSNFQEQLEVLTKAIQKDCVCSIIYKKSIFDSAKEHDFAPKRLITYSNSISVQGHLVNEKGKAEILHEVLLPVHRIEKVILTRRGSAHLPLPKANNEDIFGFMINNSEDFFRVEVEFYGKAANYVAERNWSKDQEIKIVQGKYEKVNKIILSMSVKNKEELFAWVLGYGDKAKIISPANIVEEMKDVLESIRNNYK